MLLTRRHALLAGGLASVKACTPGKHHPRPAPTLEDTLRAEAVAREQQLVALYSAVLQAHPTLSTRLAPVLSDHTAHLAALVPPTSATPSPTPTATPVSPVSVAQLGALERSTAAAHADAAVRAGTGCDHDLAPLLASLAACEASHVVLLR